MSLAISIFEILKSERSRFIKILEADSIVEFGNLTDLPMEVRLNTITGVQTDVNFVSDAIAFDQKILVHQRIFCVMNKETGKAIGAAYLFPLVIEGLLYPKFAKAVRRATRARPNPTAFQYWGWVDLRILDPTFRGRGIGSAFARKLMSSEKFKLAESFTTIVGSVNLDQPSSLGFIASLGGRSLFTFGRQCFARFELRR